jgi:hypothetical protein
MGRRRTEIASRRSKLATSDWRLFLMATLKLVFGFAIFRGLLVLICFKLIPPFFANYELEDAIKTERRSRPTARAPKKTFAQPLSSRPAITILR